MQFERHLSCAASFVLAAAAAHAQCPPEWLSTQPRTAYGTCTAVTQWDPDGDGPEPELIVYAGGAVFDGITPSITSTSKMIVGASTDLYRHTPLSRALFYTGTVNCLYNWSGRLIAAGSFKVEPGVPADHIMQYNGTEWLPFSESPAPGRITNLIDYRGTLYASTETTQALFRFNGASWEPAGPGTDGGPITAMTVFRDRLIIGGAFYKVGTKLISRIASTDGTTFDPLGPGLDSNVMSLAVLRDELYALHGSPESGNKISKWNGSSWTLIGPTTASNFAVWLDQLHVSNGKLVANERRLAFGCTATLDEFGYHSLPLEEPKDSVQAIGRHHGKLVVATSSSEAKLLIREADSWRALPKPPSVGSWPIYSIASYRGDLYITDGNSLQRWDGSTWSMIDKPDETVGFFPIMLVEFKDRLIVGTQFGVPATSLWSWDGATWRSVGDARVRTGDGMASLVDGDRLIIGLTDVYVSGDDAAPAVFESTDGINFVPLGFERWRGDVFSLTMFQGELIAAGTFTATDTRGDVAARYIAAFQNGRWQQFRQNPIPATSVIACQDRLFLVASEKLMQWNGISWINRTAMQRFAFGSGSLLAPPLVEGDRFFLGGSFDYVEGHLCGNIAAFGPSNAPSILVHPTDLSACRGSSTFNVEATADDFQRYSWSRAGIPLVDGREPDGTFISGAYTPTLTIAGARPTDAGQYTCTVTNSCGTVTSNPATLTVCPTDFNCDGFSDAADLDAFLNAFFTANPDSDINGDGFTDALDYDRFTADFVAGC